MERGFGRCGGLGRGVGGGIWNGVLQLSAASGGEACQMQFTRDKPNHYIWHTLPQLTCSSNTPPFQMPSSMSIITSGTPCLNLLVPAIPHRSRCPPQCPSLHLAHPASTYLFQQYITVPDALLNVKNNSETVSSAILKAVPNILAAKVILPGRRAEPPTELRRDDSARK